MLKDKITKYWLNRQVRQATTLYSTSLLNIFLGILISVIVTRSLGTIEYGNFKLLLAIFILATQLLGFGFFFSSSRLLVQSSKFPRTRQLFAASLIVLIIITVLIVLSAYTYSIFDKNLTNKGIGTTFVSLIPFAFIFPLTPFYDNILQGSNRINELALARGGKKLSYFILLLLFLIFGSLNLTTVLFSFYVSSILIFLIIIYRIKPLFTSIKNRLTEICLVNKKFGIQVYYGSLAMVANTHLTPLILSYFALNNIGVGLFSLALAITGPLSLVPNIIATTYFKKFAALQSIPKRLSLITISLSLAVYLLIVLFLEPVILLVYSENFLGVVPIAKITAISMLIHGMADYVNRFLGAHGKGKSLRNSSYITGAFLITMNLILIPKYGAMGAAYAKLISSTAYLISISVSYYRFPRK